MDNSFLNELKTYVYEHRSNEVLDISVLYNEITIISSPDHIVCLLRFLRDDVQTQFISIIDICGVDYPERENRFEVVYHLLSPRQNLRVRVKVNLHPDILMPSVVGLFPGADWFEREVYDMYGILFSGHPDLRRLLTDYGFEGYPLRKDFPLSGFTEVRYDVEQKRVIYEPVHFHQEFRNFDFISQWEGTNYLLRGDEKTD
ncbi:NADH-quinone oxidoreductase subunit C [Candidatus Endowatersipora endosymbiont of Watersipora subatra]|uniref:NADH-quinone oxidoreductase subunit C n=1 Tax=Candidatus Endowatersipora endosymbiont of Watersipora subatra TaxID=3077946 RepID=UPI00312C99BA